MKVSNVLGVEEAVSALRKLYETYGYAQYKMSKFEEYDFYVRNKNFLVSDQIITFNDTDGKLMALKPDVTLSIIKSGQDEPGSIQKVYYNENVYRIPKGAQSFREIMQVGLECIGDTDPYCIYEVLYLAAKSLACISDDFVLDISHMGVIAEILDSLSLSDADRAFLLQCIGEKNVHDIAKVEGAAPLQKLIATYGSADTVRAVLDEIYPDGLSSCAALLLDTVTELEKAGLKGKIRIDFSVLNDMNYYSGIVFSGFVNGIPQSVLSGGQYDHLMRKIGRNAGAIGYAIYLDMINQFAPIENGYDVDTVLLYTDKTSVADICRAVSVFRENGKSVLARKTLPTQLKYRQIVTLDEKGAFTVETNA